MSSDVIFLQAKWSKIKERVKGWKSGKKTWFKRITVWEPLKVLPKVEFFQFEGGASEWLSFFGCPPGLVFFGGRC